MELSFKDKVVVVTGGSRGIGKAIVEEFASRGATTLFTYSSSQEQAEAIASELSKGDVTTKAFKVDVTDMEACHQFADIVNKEFGGPDILINNAGIIRDQLLLTMNQDDWSSVIATNLSGAYNMIKPFIRPMMRKRKGSIVNMSSIAGSKPGRGHCNYAASKGGIEALTKALAAEIGSKGIRVNAVAPGMIETDMSREVRDLAGDQVLSKITLKRYGTTDDIAKAVLFLASDWSSYITGEVIHVDGGIA